MCLTDADSDGSSSTWRMQPNSWQLAFSHQNVRSEIILLKSLDQTLFHFEILRRSTKNEGLLKYPTLMKKNNEGQVAYEIDDRILLTRRMQHLLNTVSVSSIPMWMSDFHRSEHNHRFQNLQLTVHAASMVLQSVPQVGSELRTWQTKVFWAVCTIKPQSLKEDKRRG